MNISIKTPLGYSRVGRREQQEDAMWPPLAEASNSHVCFVVCDGVGGSLLGEVASQTTARVVGESLTAAHRPDAPLTAAHLHAAVTAAYDALDQLDQQPSDTVVTMATTLTCVCLHSEGILAAHMGDSRIYHIRPGHGLLYQSNDHSLVNSLLQAGELTLEEAKNFRGKNVITRAIQPHRQPRLKAEVHQLTDVQAGDYLFLCSDGVLERLSSERLISILSQPVSDAEKAQLLEAESTDQTKDNYTAYLIPIDRVEGAAAPLSNEVTAVVTAVQPAPATTPQPPATPSRPSASLPSSDALQRGLKIAAFVALALGFIALGVLLARWWDNRSSADQPNQQEQFRPAPQPTRPKPAAPAQRLRPSDRPETASRPTKQPASNESAEPKEPATPLPVPLPQPAPSVAHPSSDKPRTPQSAIKEKPAPNVESTPSKIKDKPAQKIDSKPDKKTEDKPETKPEDKPEKKADKKPAKDADAPSAPSKLQSA